jgi:hypothetical protein
MNQKNIKAGYIYSDVIGKRLDDTSIDMENDLQKSYIENGELYFDNKNGFATAMQEGIFMLRIPENLEIKYCDLFAQNFYKKSIDYDGSKSNNDFKEYSKFRNYTSSNFDSDSLLGFHERVDQIEQFLLEKRFWEKWYPRPIAKTGSELCRLSSIIIKRVLREVGINEQDFELATGGCTTQKGSYHLTFNHYRPQLKTKGLSSHKDDGFVTILRTVSPGLEINRSQKWEKVGVDINYFIVNFGLSMEILTRNSKFPVSAIMHRVVHQTVDRWSWGHFSSSSCVEGSDQGIFEFYAESGLKSLCSSRQLINNNDYEIYHGTKIVDGTNGQS